MKLDSFPFVGWWWSVVVRSTALRIRINHSITQHNTQYSHPMVTHTHTHTRILAPFDTDAESVAVLLVTRHRYRARGQLVDVWHAAIPFPFAIGLRMRNNTHTHTVLGFSSVRLSLGNLMKNTKNDILYSPDASSTADCLPDCGGPGRGRTNHRRRQHRRRRRRCPHRHHCYNDSL